MKKYFAIVTYNGRNFHGFERQNEFRTVQGTLEKILTELCGKTTQIKAAGRTDAKVHALAQTFCFVHPKEIKNIDKFVYAFNSLLPSDIRIKEIKEVETSFDARHSCCGKVYLYKLNWGVKDPLLDGLVTQIERTDFVFENFTEALNLFKGKHDFSNFTTKVDDKDNFIRNIRKIDITRTGEKSCEIEIESNGFMTYMVRMIIGSAIRVGVNKLTLDELSNIFNKRPRHPVSFKADPDGLYLKQVKYE